ncbi:MAG: hypothetical protein AAGI52_00785 [Bacteroidota bacterium]
MLRLVPLFGALLVLSGCQEAESPDGDGAATVPSELPASLGTSAETEYENSAPGFIGATAPETAFLLDDGAVCYIYESYAVRVSPIGSDGEPRGDLVQVGGREDGGIARDECEAASRAVTGDDEADTFSGVEGDVLLLDRASGEAGRRLVAVDLAAGGETVLDSPYEEPVEIAEGVLTFGALIREVTSADGLEGVECEQGEDYLSNDLAVGVVQIREFDLASRDVTETDMLVCVPLG